MSACSMNLLLVLIVLLLLFGGGGFYFGGPVIGGSGIGLILVICLIVLFHEWIPHERLRFSPAMPKRLSGSLPQLKGDGAGSGDHGD